MLQPTFLLIVARERKPEEDPVLSDHAKRWSKVFDLPISSFDTLFVPEGNLPKTIEHDIVLISGSRHSVYENHPWMEELKIFVRRVIDQDIPLFGVCFGHQVITEALGGKVEPGQKGAEVGAIEITLTRDGEMDPLFKGLETTFQIGSFHKDTVTLAPEGATELAVNGLYGAQAFAIGKHVRTVQFHPEFTKEFIEEVIYDSLDDLVNNGLFESKTEADNIVKKLQASNIQGTGPKIAKNVLNYFSVSSSSEKVLTNSPQSP